MRKRGSLDLRRFRAIIIVTAMLEIIKIDETIYEIVRTVARGGMAIVYEARQLGVEGFAKTVAIKMILEDYSNDPAFREMFVGEAKLVADLVHQNIAQIYQLGRHGNSYFMVMEFLSGKTVAEFTARHKQLNWQVPIELGVFIISRICRGLEYAHRKRDREGRLLGIVHRDVSPKNMIITTEGAAEDRQRALSLGANAYITKPIQAPQVIACVKKLLNL